MSKPVSTGVTAGVLLLCLTASSVAQETTLEEKRFRANRIAESPTIDGRIGAAEWAGAAKISDLHEVEPVEFTSPSERTVWYIAFDDKALYVAAYAYDSEPDKIVARTLRQGADLDSDDSMSIIIDPFNNKRSGYSFTLNPNGVRAEAIYATATRPSDEWDGIWRGASMRVDDGWTMEMSIPFNTVTFDPQNSEWGINLWRRIARKAERVAWQSRSGKVDPTVSGEVYGFEGLSQGVGLDMVPSASTVYQNDRELGTTSSDFNPSLDVSYKLTPSVNGLITINTDFAATEVDNRQLGLQRFSLFFPEKRSFFLTDFDIFQFGGVPAGAGGPGNRVTGSRSGPNGLAFFSRRIGLTSDREPVDIKVGAKVSGRMGDVDFGTLYIRQDEYVTDDDEAIAASDLAVVRVSTGVLEESAVGAIMTYGDPGSNLDSSLVGADFLYRNTRLGTNRSMQGNFWIQKSHNEGVDDKDMAWSATVGFPSRLGWEGGLQIHQVEENFDPALGFANRTGVRLYGGESGYNHVLRDNRFLREMDHSLEFARWEFLDTGQIQSQELLLVPVSVRSHAGDFARMDVRFQIEGLLPGEQPLEDIGILIPAGEYSFERIGAFTRSAGHRKVSAQLRVDDGGYYNGDMFHIRPEIQWTPNSYVSFSLRYDFNKYDFPGQSEITRQITFENAISFNAKWSLVTLAQYDNVSEDLGINSRLRLNLSAGQDIWFVINHNAVRDTAIGDNFRSTQSTAAAKIRYTFRY
jgi:hypothetical protein